MRNAETGRTEDAQREIAWNEFLTNALRIIWRRQDELRRQCRRNPLPKRIHALRIETRRLLALVTLAGVVSGTATEKVRRKLKRVLRITAEARDAHVQARALKNLMPTHPELRAFFHFLRRQETQVVRHAHRKLPKRKLAKHLTRLFQAAAAPSENRFGQPEMIQALRGALSKLLEATAAGHETPEELHHVRLAVKNVRYLAEPIQSALPAGSVAWIEGLQRPQRMLGEIHDLDLLSERLDRYLANRKPERRSLHRIQTLLARRRQRLFRQYRDRRLPAPPRELYPSRAAGHVRS